MDSKEYILTGSHVLRVTLSLIFSSPVKPSPGTKWGGRCLTGVTSPLRTVGLSPADEPSLSPKTGKLICLSVGSYLKDGNGYPSENHFE